jgi:transcriptional regulator with GAF, ATPase, and Fis domain
MDLLLDVWREACRHIEIDESVDRIARIVATQIPLQLLVIRRLDIQRARIETVTVGLCHGRARPAAAATVCDPEQFNEVLGWCRAGRVSHWPLERAEPLSGTLAPPGLVGEWLAAPLLHDNHPIGVLLLLVEPPHRFDATHVQIASALSEAMAVALANDSRLHELARDRETLEADNRALLTRLDREDVANSIVGADAGLREVMEKVAQVAPTDAPVLIFGETGAGKEVVARAIHKRSRRAHGPVVRVNCGALPPGLVDSELFGHERGSFTGAVNVRKGLFERSDGGTLFLDEIGELPLDAQVRLLRILQDGTFERVGGQKPLKADVRLVTATNRDLQEMVASGTFREDLWYRISVFPIYLPPLRERLEDIPALAAHFAWRIGKRLGGAPLMLSPSDIELLTAYPWPGNVRELAAVMERAAILGNGRELKVATALGTSPARARGSAAQNHVQKEPGYGEGNHTTLDAVIARYIEQVLSATRGRIEGPEGAAVRLGVNPHTLRSRMRKLGIHWSRFRSAS